MLYSGETGETFYSNVLLNIAFWYMLYSGETGETFEHGCCGCSDTISRFQDCFLQDFKISSHASSMCLVCQLIIQSAATGWPFGAAMG